MVGASAVATAKVTAPLVVPPRPGLTTLTASFLPAWLAAMVAVARNLVPETKVVETLTPSTLTTEAAVKLEPFSDSAKTPAPPLLGDMLQSCTGGCVIVSVTASDFVG